MVVVVVTVGGTDRGYKLRVVAAVALIEVAQVAPGTILVPGTAVVMLLVTSAIAVAATAAAAHSSCGGCSSRRRKAVADEVGHM